MFKTFTKDHTTASSPKLSKESTTHSCPIDKALDILTPIHTADLASLWMKNTQVFLIQDSSRFEQVASWPGGSQ